MCFDFLYNFCLAHFFILRRSERDIIKNVYRSSCEIHVIRVRLIWNWNFLDRISKNTQIYSRSQWPRGLRHRSSAARLLRLWVRIPPEAWLFFCCECCVLSGRGLCDGLITRPEESYRLWRIVVCDQETSKTRRLKPATEL